MDDKENNYDTCAGRVLGVKFFKCTNCEYTVVYCFSAEKDPSPEPGNICSQCKGGTLIEVDPSELKPN